MKRLNQQFTRPLKTGLTAVAALEIILCAGECVLLSHVPEAGAHYWRYVLFLVLAVPVGGFAVYAVTWYITAAETREQRLQKVRISELERSIFRKADLQKRSSEAVFPRRLLADH